MCLTACGFEKSLSFDTTVEITDHASFLIRVTFPAVWEYKGFKQQK